MDNPGPSEQVEWWLGTRRRLANTSSSHTEVRLDVGLLVVGKFGGRKMGEFWMHGNFSNFRPGKRVPCPGPRPHLPTSRYSTR